MLCVPGILSHYKFLARNGGFLQDKNWLKNGVYYNYSHNAGNEWIIYEAWNRKQRSGFRYTYPLRSGIHES